MSDTSHAHARESADKPTDRSGTWQSLGDVLARIILRLREKLGKS